MIESIWGDFLVHQVDDVQVEKVYVRLRKKSESTAAGMVRVLQAIYNRAPALGFGQVHNPACRVGLRNTAAKGNKRLTLDSWPHFKLCDVHVCSDGGLT